MMHNHAKRALARRKTLRTLIGCLALPLASAGCQHSHVATTQVVLSSDATTQEAATTEATTETSVTESGSPSVAPAPSGMGHEMAQTSRNTGHAIAEGSREFGSSAVDIVTNSATRIRNSPPESLSAPIIDIDAAMQARDWDQATAYYSSGATVAGPIGFLYSPRTGQNQLRYQIIDIPLFLGNTALMPFAFAKTLPWKPVEWKGATVEPTYTAVPPLPAE